MVLDDTRVTPAHTEVRRRQLLSDQPLGAVRPPLRGDRRRRPADRPGARGAVRLRARLLWLVVGVLPRAARCTTSSACGRRRAAAAGRSPRSRATEIGPVAGITARDRDPLHRRSSRSPASGIVVVNALAESAWGTFTIGVTIPLALLHGLLHVPAGARATSAKRRSSA